MQLIHQVPGKSEVTKFEKLHTVVFNTPLEGSKAIAAEIVRLVVDKQRSGEKCVLGLATGSSPKTVYRELIRWHKEEGVSFSNVYTFNLDEYYPMQPDAEQSYVRFMYHHLFNHLDIPHTQIHIPDGTCTRDQVHAYCQEYEQKIETMGGLDFQLLGIGRTGHIGFNEPGSHVLSETRVVRLDDLTKTDAASDFYGKEHVPAEAITMGVGTILKARRIVLMAWGEGKAAIIKKAIEGPIDTDIPATYLQQHTKTTVVLDTPAAEELIRFKTPWLVGTCEWTPAMTKKAVIWLSQKVKKPLLKLTDHDYSSHGMSDLLALQGPAYDINIHMFNQLQRTITGWPGGKPNADDTHRPVRAVPAHKRILIFSPHPDDDVISMGGTLRRLAEQGHEVHVAYQVSGNHAVYDEEVIRYAEFYDDLHHAQNGKASSLVEKARYALDHKLADAESLKVVKQIKGFIRKGEAQAAMRFSGVPDARTHFMNMPFYEDEEKGGLAEADIQMTVDLYKEIKPHQIYAAGDLSDPHGTHRICLDAVSKAIDRIKKESWFRECQVWLYRGAWQEWDVKDIEMAVPLSPNELALKRKAIFKHQSQKDMPPFPGNDPREFWQRAEDRNRENARIYDALGLAEYEAIEAFKKMEIIL